MATVIKSAWDKLTGQQEPATDKIHVSELIAAGEGDGVEFKSTLRMNLHTGQVDDKMQVTLLKTIAGFINAKEIGRAWCRERGCLQVSIAVVAVQLNNNKQT